MTTLPDVTAAALTLSHDERADLAHKLILSLDEPFDAPHVVESEWNAEIVRRLGNIESGATEGVPLDVARRHLEH